MKKYMLILFILAVAWKSKILTVNSRWMLLRDPI